LEQGKKGWKELGTGIQEMGSAITSVGVGVSVFGGILASLGLEEEGENIAEIG
jgi:hypothetical protein